jgi:hypothetical protein
LIYPPYTKGEDAMHIRLLAAILLPIAGLLGACNHFPTPLSGAPGLDAAVVVTPPSAALLTALPGGALQPDCQRAINWEETFTSDANGNMTGDINIAGTGTQYPPQNENVFERYRDNCISIYMAAIDLSYEQYKRDSISLVGNLDAGADFVQTALSAASTAVGAAGTKTLLSALATGVGTSKTTISADVLYNNSILAVFAQMDADRNSQHGVILQRIQNGTTNSGTSGSTPTPASPTVSGTVTRKLTVAIPATAKAPASTAQVTSTRTIPAPHAAAPDGAQKKPMPYTMYQAANDLLIYYEDGTFAHAVVSLHEQTGAQATNCKATVKSLKTTGTKGGTSSGGDADAAAAAAAATGSPTPAGSQQPAANPNAC